MLQIVLPLKLNSQNQLFYKSFQKWELIIYIIVFIINKFFICLNKHNIISITIAVKYFLIGN